MGTNKSIDNLVSGQGQAPRNSVQHFLDAGFSPGQAGYLLRSLREDSGDRANMVMELSNGLLELDPAMLELMHEDNAVYTTSFADVGERPTAIGHQVVNVTEAIQPDAEYHRGPTYQPPER